jgi:hypothetical protein
MKFSPIFESIMQKLKSLPESEYDSPTGMQLFRLAHKYAPPEFNDHVVQQAQAEGLFPKPTHCDAEGNPLYSIEEIAGFFQQTPEQAQQALNEMIADDPDVLYHIHNGTTHPLN